jgi:hypothetical protein
MEEFSKDVYGLLETSPGTGGGGGVPELYFSPRHRLPF